MAINEISESDTSSLDSRSVNQSSEAGADERRRSAAIDSEQLLRQCVGNLSFATSLLCMFEESSESRLASFDRALQEQRTDVIANGAHALKGIAGILAANKLTAVCLELESAAEEADWNCLRNLVETLHHEMQRVINCIPDIQALNPSESAIVAHRGSNSENLHLSE